MATKKAVEVVEPVPATERPDFLPGDVTTAELQAAQGDPPTDDNGNVTGPGSEEHQEAVKAEITRKTRVVATAHIADGADYYRPGDVIEGWEKDKIVHFVDANLITIEGA